jgi:hypothetical protein
MYRQGLGDCFLLTFDVGGASPRHVLIDCGSLGATTTGVKMKDVVADIKETSGGRLELLIITHEHEDHVDGFRDQEAAFTADDFDVKNVWLAWTENPEDERAKELEKFEGDLVAALTASLAGLAASPDPDDADAALAIRDLMGFAGPMRADGLGFAKTVHKAMELVRTGLGVTAKYLKPTTTPIEPAFLPGFRFYVLGPPRAQERIEDVGEEGSSELFHATAGLAVAARLKGARRGRAAHVARLDAPGRAAFEKEMPFDVRYCVDERGNRAALKRAYGKTYFARGQEWRRIDHDWLQAASDLALQLDSLTNNTSLALAIERIADGKVLLFPADAQLGNWLSWHDPDRKWSVPAPDGSTQQIRATDLLSRVVFYKVGHHASHNATAKGKGLELMTETDELVAFIPVDRAVALNRNPKKSWKMPARALYRALLEHCQGRVVRSDLGWADDAANAANATAEEAFLNMATTAEWQTWKQAQQAAGNRVQVTPRFIDYFMD